MTLQEWKAAQLGQGRSTVADPAPTPPAVAPQGGEPTPEDGPLGAMRHATSGDDYTSAFMGEVGRTAKEAGIGLARSPLDLVKGAYNTVAHPLDTLMGLGHTIAHPVEAVENLAKNPRDAGSLLGQMLLAPKVPEAANTALAKGPGIVGRGMGAVGRGAEALGQSKAVRGASKLGAIGSAMHGNIPGVLTALAPEALEMTGRGMQRGGAALEGLDLSLGKKGAVATIPESRRLGPARVSTEVPNYGSQLDAVDGPGSWERSPSDNPLVPGRRNPSITGLENAAVKPPVEVEPNAFTGNEGYTPETARLGNTLNDPNYDAKVAAKRAPKGKPMFPQEDLVTQLENSLADSHMKDYGPDQSGTPGPAPTSNVESAVENAQRMHRVQRVHIPDSLAGLSDAAQKPAFSPIDQFYQSDPQARIGGEGRMTGAPSSPLVDDVFGMGGGLDELSAGNVDPHVAPSTLDQLSQLSGRALSPADAQALLSKYRNFATVQ